MRTVRKHEQDPGRAVWTSPRDLRVDVRCGRCERRLGYIGAYFRFGGMLDHDVRHGEEGAAIGELLAILADRFMADWKRDNPTRMARLEDFTEHLGARMWHDIGLTTHSAAGATLGITNNRAMGWRLEADCTCGAHYEVRLERIAGPWLHRCTGWRASAGDRFADLRHDTSPILLGIDVPA